MVCRNAFFADDEDTAIYLCLNVEKINWQRYNPNPGSIQGEKHIYLKLQLSSPYYQYLCYMCTNIDSIFCMFENPKLFHGKIFQYVKYDLCILAVAGFTEHI